MKILVLGATGLIGKEIFKHFSKKNSVFGTFNDKKKINKIGFNKKKLFYFDVLKRNKLDKIIKNVRPKLVINCIGITKHIKKISNKKVFIVNGYFPHIAKKISNLRSAKFVQISTDCVFNGKDGNYKETSIPNADDVYGKSKAYGEINDNTNLTVRTSTIGHEFFTRYGLLEWFLNQKTICYGYENAVFNGFTTLYFAEILEKLINKKITGLINVSGIKINKYSLLKKIKKIYKKDILIKKNTIVKVNRSLDNKLLIKYLPKVRKDWDKLIMNMKNENRKQTFSY